MVKFFKQSQFYEESWPTVTLAYFLRYPNPFSTHVASVDVLSRTFTANNTLVTTRLILKRGNLPRWAPRGILARAESWVIEESEVDALGRVVSARTRNLDHVKILKVTEHTELREAEAGGTVHITSASIRSNFSRVLRDRIEKFGLSRFKTNVDRSRQGLSIVVNALRNHRLQFLDGAVGGIGPWDLPGVSWQPTASRSNVDSDDGEGDGGVEVREEGRSASIFGSWRE